MKKKVLLQFGMNEKRLTSVFQAMKNLNLEYGFFSYLREDKIIDDFPEDFIENDWVSFASIPVVLYATRKNPIYYKSQEKFEIYNDKLIDSFYNDDLNNLEQEHILNGIKNGSIPYIPMLNENSKFLAFDSLKEIKFEKPLFIKPNSTMKQFIGGVALPGETFEEFLARMKFCGTKIGVMVSDVHHIHSEYRFFVYKGEVLTGSSYFLNKKLVKDYPIPQEVYSEARRIAKLYQPGIAFTLDLALLQSGKIKVVEYNKFCASGPYNCNMEDVLKVMCFDF